MMILFSEQTELLETIGAKGLPHEGPLDKQQLTEQES
jgi:hypothetical protein